MIGIVLNKTLDCNNLCQIIEKEIQKASRNNVPRENMLLSIQIKEIIEPDFPKEQEIKNITFSES